VTTQILDCDDKRLHFFHRMYHATEGYLAATTEILSVHVDMESRRTAPFPDQPRQILNRLKNRHQTLPKPDQAGRIIGIRKK
jgi:acyl-CoA thioester hydrolase